MSWFAAHIIMVVKLKRKRQTRFPVWENIVLVQADSHEEAFAKAERRGVLEAGDDGGSFRWDGQPASWVFAGVRKLTLCENPEARPKDGTEISYIEFLLKSEEALQHFLNGEPVPVQCEDRFHERTVEKAKKTKEKQKKLA